MSTESIRVDEVVLRYTAPVYVTVDLAGRRVRRVQVMDGDVGEPELLDDLSDDLLDVERFALEEAAIGIAENEVWPSWEWD